MGNIERIIYLLIGLLGFVSCDRNPDVSALKQEILQTEKAFEKMVEEEGFASAFAYYADSDAVILREGSLLIRGKDNIRSYYDKPVMQNATLHWHPDYIDVSRCGTMAYSYGRYTWSQTDSSGIRREFAGFFHTVWKRKSNGSWKYVWD